MAETDWIDDLSKRGNLLYGPTGHISILLEDIPKYVSTPDFENEKIRDIYTIGRIIVKDKCKQILKLTSCESKGDGVEIYALCHQSYLKASHEIPHNRVHSFHVQVDGVYKFYGSLRCETNSGQKNIIIDVHMILQVNNVKSCLKTLELTSRLCCQYYYQHYHSSRMETRMNEWWDKVTAEREKKLPK